MEITVFAKKRTTKEGKPFFGYISTLTRKDGTNQSVSVRFREQGGYPKPETCPLNIKFNKDQANLSTKEYTREDTGELATTYILWISEWEYGSPYVDDSLDDFV